MPSGNSDTRFFVIVYKDEAGCAKVQLLDTRDDDLETTISEMKSIGATEFKTAPLPFDEVEMPFLDLLDQLDKFENGIALFEALIRVLHRFGEQTLQAVPIATE
jgi:hypothetical protein